MGIESALINKRAAGKAADVSAQASDRAAQLAYQAAQEATAEQRRQYDQSRADLMPWLESGRGALGRLDRASTGDMSQFMASPDYNFRRTEGTRDIGNSFAARGGAASGNALRALSEFNSGLASGEFGNWWNRQAGMAGVGQTTGNQLSSLGANAASAIGNINTGAANQIGQFGQMGANARASGMIAGQNAMNQGAQNTAAWMGRIFGWGG